MRWPIPYRVEWRVRGPASDASPVTRWSAHDTANDARAAALMLAASATTVDGEVRIVASATDGGPRAAITDAGGLAEWDPAESELPAIKEEASWAKQRVRAGLRGAILLTCRTALDRGVAAGLLSDPSRPLPLFRR